MRKIYLYLFVLIFLSSCSSKQFAFRKTIDAQTAAEQPAKQIREAACSASSPSLPDTGTDVQLLNDKLREVMVTEAVPAKDHQLRQKTISRAGSAIFKTSKANSTADVSKTEKPAPIGSLLALLLVCMLLVILVVGIIVAFPVLVFLAALFLVIFLVLFLVGLLLGL